MWDHERGHPSREPGLGLVAFSRAGFVYPDRRSTYASAYQGQVAGSTYTVQWGDSLGNIAAKEGYSLSDMLAVNPQIWDASLIYPGEVINLPASGYASGSARSANDELRGAMGIPAGYSILKVTNQKGLYIRTGPGIDYPTIESPTAYGCVSVQLYLYQEFRHGGPAGICVGTNYV